MILGLPLAAALLLAMPACRCLAPLPEVAPDEAAIRGAIAKGVRFLLSDRRGDFWLYREAPTADYDLGCTALVGLALAAGDGKGTAAAQAHIEQLLLKRSGELRQTYPLAFAILFLERRGKPTDSLVRRLLAGQDDFGQWSYDCGPNRGMGDNSNTQAALLALLVVRQRKSSQALEGAIARAEAGFRATQQESGGWGYHAKGAGMPTVTMTCAGLLALARPMLPKEVSLRAAPVGAESDGSLANLLRDRQVQAARAFLIKQLPTLKEQPEHYLSFAYWSIERTALLYGSRDFFDLFDWYAEGSAELLRWQRHDGSWNVHDRLGATADTAFAVLFLSRLNLLETKEVVLKAGDLKESGAASRQEGTPEEAQRLGLELRTAFSSRVDEILAIMQDRRHNAYRDALVEALEQPDLRSSTREKIRRALAKRISLASPRAIQAYLRPGESLELRLAAVAAIQMGNHRQLLPSLADLVSDADAKVAEASLAVLRRQTGQDFGKNAGAWKRWLTERPEPR